MFANFGWCSAVKLVFLLVCKCSAKCLKLGQVPVRIALLLPGEIDTRQKFPTFPPNFGYFRCDIFCDATVQIKGAGDSNYIRESDPTVTVYSGTC